MELGKSYYWSTTFHTYGLYVGRDETIYYFDGIEVTEAYNERHIKRKTAFLPDKLCDRRNKRLAYRPRTCFGNASDMYVDYVRVFAENDIQYSIPLLKK